MEDIKEFIKERKRALRRIHRRRVMRNRKNYYAMWVERADAKTVLGRLARTATPCSCAGCGNPRKYFNQKTRQELRSVLSYIEDTI
jgi:hypothetical protein